MASKKDMAVKMAVPSRPKPTLTIDEKDLPAIKGWKVGTKYDIHIKAEMISVSKGSGFDYEGDSKRPYEARFKVITAKECKP